MSTWETKTMVQGEVKLLGTWSSPHVLGPRIALNIKTVDYEFLEETYGSPSELLLQSNPVHKKVPVLLHEGKPICETLVIIEYIDEVWSSGPSILPSDPYDRAIARFWASYVFEKWFPCVRGINACEVEEARKALLNQAEECLLLLEDVYNKCSRGKTFFGEDQIGYLDIAFGSFLGWLRVAEKFSGQKLLDEAKVPGLVKWANSFCSHPAVKDVMPETDKLAEFSKVIRLHMRASGGPPK